MRASRADGLNKDPELFFPTFLHFRFFSSLAGEKESFFLPIFSCPCWGHCLCEELKRPNNGRYPHPMRTHRHPAAPTICHRAAESAVLPITAWESRNPLAGIPSPYTYIPVPFSPLLFLLAPRQISTIRLPRQRPYNILCIN